MSDISISVLAGQQRSLLIFNVGDLIIYQSQQIGVFVRC